LKETTERRKRYDQLLAELVKAWTGPKVDYTAIERLNAELRQLLDLEEAERDKEDDHGSSE
jgi:hypothetical protein